MRPHSQSWWIDQVGKRVYRSRPDCNCDTCLKTYKDGIVVIGAQQATALHNQEQTTDARFFPSKEDRYSWEINIRGRGL